MIAKSVITIPEAATLIGAGTRTVWRYAQGSAAHLFRRDGGHLRIAARDIGELRDLVKASKEQADARAAFARSHAYTRGGDRSEAARAGALRRWAKTRIEEKEKIMASTAY